MNSDAYECEGERLLRSISSETRCIHNILTDKNNDERNSPMRIAQVAPLWESVPPKLYGGTERIVSYLTEELVRLGHDVTLFASGDSITTARLEAICRSCAPSE